MKKKVISIFTLLAMLCSFLGIMSIMEVSAAEYNAQAAVDYANQYALNYNPNYSNYNDIGGDCANFVSQCMRAGGLEMDSGWYWYSRNNHSESWTYCPTMIKYFQEKKYDVITNASATDIKPGNPVFYYSSKKGTWSHVAICVGYNSSGVPIVNAHNNDRKQVNWQLGGSAYGYSKFATVLLNSGGTPPTPVEKPSWATLTVNSTSFDINEPIIFTAKSDTATEYYLHIDKDSKRLCEELMPDGNYSTSLNEPGHYTANVTARNSAGWVDSEWIGFDIITAPSWATLHTENYIVNYNVNDTINFIASSDTATKYFLSIDKDSKRLWTEEMPDGKYSIKLTETGYYTACVTARNNSGWVDSEYIGIRILKPTDVGDNRNVYIENKHSGLVFTRDGQNVIGAENKLNDKQLWQLNRQSDGSYRIKSCYDNQYLEVFEAGITNGTNISVYEYTPEFINQSFYIYNLFDAYYIKPICSDLFVDMSFESPNNVATYGYADDWEHQKFIFIDESDYKTTAPATTTITTTATSIITTTTTTEQLPVTTTTSSTTTNTNVIPVTTTTTSTTIQLPITTTAQTETTVPMPIKTNADLNADGKINAADIVEFQKIALKKYNDIAYIVDLNGDGVMNVFDMILLRRMVLKG